MVFSFVEQPEGNYLKYKRFHFPTSHGPVDAVAVPSEVQSELTSAYTIMAGSIVINVWAIVIAIGMYYYLRMNKGPDVRHQRSVTDLSMSIWNKKASPQQSLLDTLLYAREDLKHWWFYPLCITIVAVWTAKVAAGILIPRTLFVGYGAPVNPTSIFVPEINYDENDQIHLRAAFALDVPLTLRAAGSALVASDTLKSSVHVGNPTVLGSTGKGQDLRLDYAYNVSGLDFGLQSYPSLLLNVTGSCRTDYSWFNVSATTPDGEPAHVDIYYPWNVQVKDNRLQVSIDDGLQPSGTFLLNTMAAPSPPTNFTWGAIVSSVDRYSYTVGTDPWYLTGPSPGSNVSGSGVIPNIVLPGRPALSCWENDVWSYLGQPIDVHNFNSTIPVLDLPAGLQAIFQRYFFEPRIVNVAQRLVPSNLQSATTSLGGAFDASSASIKSDLERLVLASYIATTNTFTDTTLYPESGQANSATVGGVPVPNIVLDNLGNPLPGVDGFVVYSSNVVALSVRVLIIVPTVTFACWLLTLITLKLTPLKLSTAMEVSTLFQELRDQFPEANIHINTTTNKAGWYL
ncbi:hypothetical protein GQ53DRAFT_767084 [Thozetella sp. PMI_491]|nr:hypothetical protein GQ53DRAFT_767084 [Thozetella sp. PMI_491]